jgi:hypothetical protein
LQVEEIVKGGSIEIEIKFNGKTVNFRNEVVLIRNNSILIDSIKVNDQTVGFSDKCRINFMYKSEGKLYIWEDVSVKLVKYDGAIYHKIELFGDGLPYNRRDSYRLYIGEDMFIHVNTPNGPAALSVLVKDISETGVGFITHDDLAIDRIVRLKLKDNNATLTLSGVIVRKEFLDHLNSFLYGCKFNEKNDKLGKYIAKRQGELLRKKSNLYSPPTPRDVMLTRD